MGGKPVSQVQRQVAKASRRLFLQAFLNSMAWCWAAALLATTVWFLAQPWLIGEQETWVRWAVAAGFFIVANFAGVWLTVRRAPSRVEAALELDLRFHLKERATTSLTLTPELRSSEAGQALAADAEAHIAKVNVGQGFPIRLRWTTMLVPVAAAVLAVVAIFYQPDLNGTNSASAKESQKVANAKEIAERADKLTQMSPLTWPKDQPDEKLQEIEKLREKLFDKKFDPSDKDKLREQLQKFVSLEEKLRDRMDDLKSQQDRAKAMQDRLKEMAKDRKREPNREGPAKDLQDALDKGDLTKAQKEFENLAEKLKDNKLSEEERKKLQQQLQEIQSMLSDVADLRSLKTKLAGELAAGKISKEQFDKLMAKAAEDAEDLRDLKELSDILAECKDIMDPKELAKKLCEGGA